MSSITQILWIGAGGGESLQLPTVYSKLIAVEARREACQQLSKLKYQIPQLQVVEALVSCKNTAENFYRYSIAGLSASRKATGLTNFFPGLKLISTETIQAKSLAELIKELDFDLTVNSALWLDTPSIAVPLLKHLVEHKLLRQFRELKVCLPPEVFYENQSLQSDAFELLSSNCFDLTNVNEDIPEFPSYTFQFNSIKQELRLKNSQLKKRTLELTELKLTYDATLAKLDEVEQHHKEYLLQSEKIRNELVDKIQQETLANDVLSKQIEVLKLENVGILENLKQQKLDFEKQLECQKIQSSEELQQCRLNQEEKFAAIIEANNVEKYKVLEQLAEEQHKCSLLKHELDLQNNLLESMKKEHETIAALNLFKDRIEYLFDQNRLQLQQAANAVGQHITAVSNSTISDMQNFLRYQQLLGSTEHILKFQNQVLDSQLALSLRQMVFNSDYNLILNFGSEVMACFLASQLQNALLNSGDLLDNQTTKETLCLSDDFESIKHIVSFDHQRSLSEALSKHLEHVKLDHLVNVVTAPLIDVRFSGHDYLFFDCRSCFTKISEHYKRSKAKFLVVLSLEKQLPALTNEACLPALIQEFSRHHIDILVYAGSEQYTELKKNWEKILNEREIEYNLVEDKHARTLLLAINPD